MAKTKLRKYLSFEVKLIVLGLALLLGTGYLGLKIQKPVIELTKQETAININNNFLQFLHLGNKRLITDVLWIQTLLESDNDHYKKRDLNSWMFLRFNSIALLDPKFYENYLYGGQFLSIIKDDLEGAEVIYDKGLRHYPEDYALNYNAGFLNYYELGNHNKGIELLDKVVDHPKAPIFLHSIVNKLRLEAGTSLEIIYQLVLHNYETTEDETLKRKLERDLYAIKAEIDLKCLNNNGPNCSSRDFDGDPYIKRGNTYYASKEFLLYRINKRGETTSPLPRKNLNTIK